MPASRGGLAQRLAHRVRVVVRAAARPVVQVVELADAGHPGEHHLGEDGPGQREVGVRVEPGGDGVHRSRQVQNVPPPPCVRPRRARWNAWLWALASPGSTRRPSRGVAGSAASSGATAVIRPSVDLEQHGAPQAPPGSRACSATRTSVDRAIRRARATHVGQRLDAGEAVVRLGVLGG